MIHEIEWNFFIRIGDNEWSTSDVIKSRDIDTARQRANPKVHQFVKQLIKSAEEGTLEVKYPAPLPDRKTFNIEWGLIIGDSPIIHHKNSRARTILDSLRKVKKEIRGRI